MTYSIADLESRLGSTSIWFVYYKQWTTKQRWTFYVSGTPASISDNFGTTRCTLWHELLWQAGWIYSLQYCDVIMNVMASHITSVSIVCSTVCSGADQRKHQSSVPLASVRGIHRWPVNCPHKGPVTRKIFPFDDVIMCKIQDIEM